MSTKVTPICFGKNFLHERTQHMPEVSAILSSPTTHAQASTWDVSMPVYPSQTFCLATKIISLHWQGEGGQVNEGMLPYLVARLT